MPYLLIRNDPPNGTERGIVQKGAAVGACGTCMDARGPSSGELMDGVHRSDLEELGTWTPEADEVIVF